MDVRRSTIVMGIIDIGYMNQWQPKEMCLVFRTRHQCHDLITVNAEPSAACCRCIETRPRTGKGNAVQGTAAVRDDGAVEGR